MKNRRKNIIILLLPFIAVPLVVFGAYIYIRYVRIYVFPCPVRFFGDFYCPGCGATRCIYALLRGDFITALRCNALIIGAIALFILYWLENLAALFGKSIKIIPESRIFVIAVSGIVIAYSVLRNIFPILAPI